jgi:hypothetical protein
MGENESTLLPQKRKVFSQSSQRESPAGLVFLREICEHLREIFFGFPQRR